MDVTKHEHTMVYSCDDTMERPDSGTAENYRSETAFEHAHEDGHLPHHHTAPQSDDSADSTDADMDTDADEAQLNDDLDQGVEDFDRDVTGLWS